MDDEELNRAIAEALGWTEVRSEKLGRFMGWYAPSGAFATRIPNYANSIDASMAVIRERWPDGVVVHLPNECWLFLSWRQFHEWDETWPSLNFPISGDGPDDAFRLADALLEALK